MTTSPPHAHHEIAPAPAPTLTELVARARHAKQPKTAQLEPHREELIRLRREGDSVEVLATALRGLGVEISDEALRLWLNRQLPRRKTRRNRSARAAALQEPTSALTPVREGPIAARIADEILGTTVAANSGPSAAVAATAAAPKEPAPVNAPARAYVPWRNNFEPLVVVGTPRRNPRIARDDL